MLMLQMNGLKLSNSWAGYLILLNPPYTAAAQWRFVNRAIDEVENDRVCSQTAQLLRHIYNRHWINTIGIELYLSSMKTSLSTPSPQQKVLADDTEDCRPHSLEF